MKKYLILIILFLAGLIVSGINPHDYFTWILEVFRGIIGFIVLVLTYKKFQFTYLTYMFILLHCYILFIGGHYTYAQVPLFNWIRDIMHQSRNNYDKVGHFAQGFIPAMVASELYNRLHVFNKTGWIPFFVVCTCTTISVLYEFLEWLVSVLSGSSGDSFLGTQGDIWDTQSDMLCAMIGAIFTVIFLSKILNNQIKKCHNRQTVKL